MERYVECESRGLTLRGMLHVPDQRPGKVPFVILFHGFCDDRNEINFVHTELSRRLCERGIASVRFDFAGHWRSPAHTACGRAGDRQCPVRLCRQRRQRRAVRGHDCLQ